MRAPGRLSPAAGLLVVALLAARPAAAAYEEVAVPDGGVLTGVVRFAGPAPRLEPWAVAKNRDVCGGQKPSEALVVGPEGGVKGSVIRIEGITRGKKSAGEVLLDAHGCLFVSHVTAAAAGDRARVKNSDAVLHNTQGFLGARPVFNVALPGKDQVVDITRRLTRPGVVRVLCGAHPHMFAWLVLHDSPYLAVTDERGAFHIDGVPPGRYKVTMWHEGYRPTGAGGDGRPRYGEPRTATREVAISPGSTATVEFQLK